MTRFTASIVLADIRPDSNDVQPAAIKLCFHCHGSVQLCVLPVASRLTSFQGKDAGKDPFRKGHFGLSLCLVSSVTCWPQGANVTSVHLALDDVMLCSATVGVIVLYFTTCSTHLAAMCPTHLGPMCTIHLAAMCSTHLAAMCITMLVQAGLVHMQCPNNANTYCTVKSSISTERYLRSHVVHHRHSTSGHPSSSQVHS